MKQENLEVKKKKVIEINQHKIDWLINKMCEEKGVSCESLKTKSKKSNLVEARQIIMSVLKNHTILSTVEIGSLFNKDHATVSHAVKAINNDCDTNKQFKDYFDEIEREFVSLFGSRLNKYEISSIVGRFYPDKIAAGRALVCH